MALRLLALVALTLSAQHNRLTDCEQWLSWYAYVYCEYGGAYCVVEMRPVSDIGVILLSQAFIRYRTKEPELDSES